MLSSQGLYHLLLFLLFALQGGFCLSSLAQQVVLVASHLSELLVFLRDLFLLLTDELSLCTLVGGIFTDETQSTVYLCEVLGTKDEHQLVLYAIVTSHVTHGLDELCLALVELGLE